MKFLVVLLFCGIASVSCQTWASRARLVNPGLYFAQLMEETVHELEKFEWCNLKVSGHIQTLNEQMYKWHVQGTVNYTNGFLVSIQNIDLTNIENLFSTRTIDNVTRTVAVVRGMMNLRDAKIGFDALVDLEDEEQVQRYTGEYTHPWIQFQCIIEKDLHTQAISTFAQLNLLNAGTGIRMIYMPSNSVTEVLSRRYTPSNNWNGVSSWGSTVIAPFMLNLARNKIPFPELCFNCS